MKSIYKYILTLYIILYSSLHIFADQGAFKSLSVSDGMTDLVVNSIYKDSKGFMWFGTNSSIERFDGVRLKRYDIDALDNKKRVYDFVEGSNYGILCGTDCGVYQFDRIKDKFIPLFKDEIDCRVNSLYCFSQDTLLVATEKGLFVCTKENVVKSPLHGAFILPQNNVTDIVPSEDSLSVWLPTLDGIVNYKPSTNDIVRYRCKDKGLSNSFYNMALIGNYLYLGTMDCGIVRFDIKSHKFSSYIDVGCSVISSLSSNNKDMLYVGTDGNGVHFISVEQNSIMKSYRHIPGSKDGIRSNSVYSVLVDRDALIWIGLYQMGVDYTLYQSGLFEVYHWKDKFTSKDMSVRTISFNGEQRLIGSRDGLIFIDEKRDIVKSYNIPELRSNIITSSCFYKNRFFIGTYGGGMYVFNPQTLVLSDFNVADKTFINGHVFCIRPDYDGNLWVGTSTGLYCFNGDKQLYHFESSGSKLPDGNVYEVYFDSLHRGWICTETGVCMWDSYAKTIRNNVFPDGFINSEKIRAVYETSLGVIYFIPEKGKIFRTSKDLDNFTFVGNSRIVADKQFLSIVEDKSKGLFITTNNGLYRKDSSMNVIPYNFTDGIPDPIFTNCISVRDSLGIFWFGNSKGLVYLKPEKINKLRKNNYKIEITDVYIDGKKLEYTLSGSDNIYKLQVDNNIHSINVLFSGMIYTNPSNMIYEYCINDEDGWIPLHGISKISLYDIKNDLKLQIRRAGYPESETVLYINVLTNNTILVAVICIIFLSIVFIYIFRRWIMKCTIGNLKRFIVWLQSREKTDNSIVASEQISNNNEYEINAMQEEILDRDIDNQLDIYEDKYKNYKLSDEECKRLIKILDREMTKNKLYTNKSLKIADLADVAKTSSHALSYVFNQYMQKSYYDYINEYRVEEFKSAILKDKYSKYTLEALSEHCGFSSRASFFRSFKKVTGITPNEYIKNVKISDKDGK